MAIMEDKNNEVLTNIRNEIDKSEKNRKVLRLKHNISLLCQGQFQVLKSEEFVFGLTEFLTDIPEDNRDEQSDILRKIGQSSLVSDAVIKERSVMILSICCEKYLVDNVNETSTVLADILSEWLKVEDEFITGFAVIIKRIEDLTIQLIENNELQYAQKILNVISQIQTKELKRSKAIVGLVNSTQNKIASRVIIEKFTDAYLREDKNQSLYKKLLTSLGKKAVIYLLTRVINSHSRIERLLLIDLIPSFGKVGLPVFIECLQKNPPWPVVRNILYVISKLKDQDLFDHIRKYLNHEDPRVQHEAIRCIVEIGGNDLQSRLLEAVQKVDDKHKIKIIYQLVEMEAESQSAAEVLYALSKKDFNVTSAAGLELQKTLIVALKKYPFPKSVAILESMKLALRKKKGTEKISFLIDESLKVLEPQMRHSKQTSGTEQDGISFDTDPVQKNIAFAKTRKVEEEIAKYLKSGNVGAAGELIYDHALEAARAKDFTTSEILRDRLLEVNPMALSEVIELGEAIEQEKGSSVSQSHIQIWKKLYDMMSPDEYSDLYKGLRQEVYAENSVIAQKGDIDSSLFFLNSGYVGLSSIVGSSETFLKKMQPGHILGGDQFFSVSVWTVTLKALTEVQAQVLDRDIFKKLEQKNPSLLQILKRYSAESVQIPELLQMTGDDRREFPRFPTAMLVQNVLLDPYGNRGKRNFKGELIDISAGGLAFTIKISSMENARMLLGRQIVTDLPIQNGKVCECNGVIVGVKYNELVESDYSIHVKLIKNIGSDVLKNILSAKKRMS